MSLDWGKRQFTRAWMVSVRHFLDGCVVQECSSFSIHRKHLFLDSVHIYGNVLLQERTHSRLIGRI